MRRLLLVSMALVCGRLVLADMEIGGITLREGPQDLVQVKTEEWAWRSGAEMMPAVSFTLKSGRFTYQIRHDRKSGGGTLGLSLPTQCNWYQSGMIFLLLDGKRFEMLPAHGETVRTAHGRKGMVQLAWETGQAKVQATFVLLAGQDRLYLELLLEPKADLQSVAVGLMNYTSGFNHQPRHVLWTPRRALDQPGRQNLQPADEHAVFFSDASLDPADNPAAAGPSAFVFDPADVSTAFLHPGGYGIGGQIAYRPDTRRLRFCFWEYPAQANTEALAAFQQSHAAARAELMSPGLFDFPVTEGGAP